MFKATVFTEQLTKSLKITAVSDFIISGNDAMFHCNSSSIIISNSI